MSWRDPKFKYHNAEETKKPGYLAKRFAAIRKEQAEAEKRLQEEAAEKIIKVRQINRR